MQTASKNQSLTQKIKGKCYSSRLPLKIPTGFGKIFTSDLQKSPCDRCQTHITIYVNHPSSKEKSFTRKKQHFHFDEPELCESCFTTSWSRQPFDIFLINKCDLPRSNDQNQNAFKRIEFRFVVQSCALNSALHHLLRPPRFLRRRLRGKKRPHSSLTNPRCQTRLPISTSWSKSSTSAAGYWSCWPSSASLSTSCPCGWFSGATNLSGRFHSTPQKLLPLTEDLLLILTKGEYDCFWLSLKAFKHRWARGGAGGGATPRPKRSRKVVKTFKHISKLHYYLSHQNESILFFWNVTPFSSYIIKVTLKGIFI